MNKKALLLFLSTYLFIINLSAQNPTVWRGNGTGVYHETGLLNEWPADGPEILWSFEELGNGHSSPVIANNTIYVSGMVEETGYV